MKKTWIITSIIAIIALNIWAFGEISAVDSNTPQEGQQGIFKDGKWVITKPKPIALFDNIMRPEKKWLADYGDKKESRLIYNIALITNVVNNQGKAIEELKKQIATLQTKKVIDPNE